MDLLELRLHLAERDEGQHRLGVLVGTKGAVRPQLIGGSEQPPRDVLQIGSHWSPCATSPSTLKSIAARLASRFGTVRPREVGARL